MASLRTTGVTAWIILSLLSHLVFPLGLHPSATFFPNSTLSTAFSKPTKPLRNHAIQAAHAQVTPMPPALHDIPCPEMLGATEFFCADAWCGGEQSTAPGHCVKANPLGTHCRCVAGARDQTTSLTTITSVVSGTPVAATYLIQTIPEYTSLRKHINTTLTMVLETTTATVSLNGTGTNDELKGLQEVVGIIAAGGILWVLAEGIGLGAVPPELPGENPNENDDPKCPEPNYKCSDQQCGGHEGICTVGTVADCPCDEPECPAKEDLMCEEERCAGKEEVCSKEGSEVERCPCTYTPCPRRDFEGGPPPGCDACGGAIDGLALCNGLDDSHSDQKTLYACPCRIFPPDIPLRWSIGSKTTQQIGWLWGNTSAKFDDEDWALDPNNNTEVCPGEDVPQFGKPINNYWAQSFCRQRAGRAVRSQGRGWAGIRDPDFSQLSITLQENGPLNWTGLPMWLSIYRRESDEVPASHNCDNSESGYVMTRSECIDALTLAVDRCENGNYSRGGTVHGYCLNYDVIPQYTYDAFSPPWNPVPEYNLPKCGDGGKPGTIEGVDVRADFWAGMYTTFCGNVHGTSPNTYAEYTTRDYNVTGNPNVNPSLHPFNEPWRKYANDWRFGFASTNVTSSCASAEWCMEAFNRFSNSSCGVAAIGNDPASFNRMVQTGQVHPEFTDGTCAFSYSIYPPETWSHSCNLKEEFYPPGTDTGLYTKQAVNPDEANPVIQEFCEKFLPTNGIPHPLPADGIRNPTWPAIVRRVGDPTSINAQRYVRVEAMFAVDRDLSGNGGTDDPEIFNTQCENRNFPVPSGVDGNGNGNGWGGIGCTHMLTESLKLCADMKRGFEDCMGTWTYEHEDPRGCVVYTVASVLQTNRKMMLDPSLNGTLSLSGNVSVPVVLPGGGNRSASASASAGSRPFLNHTLEQVGNGNH